MNSRWEALAVSITFFIVSLILFYVIGAVFGGALDIVDIDLYFRYAKHIFVDGMIPYVTMNIEYPPFAIIPMIISYIVAFGNPDTFLNVHMAIMALFHLGTTLLTYLVTRELFGRKRAIVACILIALSPAVVYFTLFRYDVVPTFLMMLSIYLYFKSSNTKSYISAAIGGLMKWFPFLLVPFYMLHAVKEKKRIKVPLIATSILIASVTIPFAIINLQGFLYPYIFHVTRPAQAEGLFYLIDEITGLSTNAVANIVLITSIGAVLIAYYMDTRASKRILFAYVTLAMVLFMMLNKVASPQYIVWITPLIAIMLSDTIFSVTSFIMLQTITYYQFPISVTRIFDPTHYIIRDQALLLFGSKYIIFLIIIILLILKIKEHDPQQGKQQGNIYIGAMQI